MNNSEKEIRKACVKICDCYPSDEQLNTNVSSYLWGFLAHAIVYRKLCKLHISVSFNPN